MKINQPDSDENSSVSVALLNESARTTVMRVEETLMMNHIGDQFTKKEGFWVEKRSDISQYFLFIDILRQYKKQLENISTDARLTDQQLCLLHNFSELHVIFADNFYEKIFSFLKIQVDLARCSNLNFGKWGIWIFLIVQIVKIGIYCFPIILTKYFDLYYILLYQLIILSSLCYFLLILCNLLIAMFSRIEAIKKMKLNDKIISYENSYSEFIFNDRLTHSLSDGLSWFFILKLKKEDFIEKVMCCQFELNQDFMDSINKKYDSLYDSDEIITIVHNAKWKVKNTKAYKSLNDIVFNSQFIFEIFLAFAFSISYGYYLVDDFVLF